ncbi:DNA-binding transcriptional LysR family regulator [Natronospira proteinivora]|uniref:DNA-binding transcriptional LysR family regulator n=1 Tax=Natronospira proteinivora TaxID=1807133 RepID=A0ABT1G5H6_9GAMM|nr:LysR family transcriptional regulator [Natronospira proteinivora]MCP1726549.1 DNA-binding transcriptional LysR family regulator [Natronospira proteinivora]
MQDLNDLYYYAQVVDHGGFAPAARALGEAKSKLSRRVAALEAHLGVRLLQRSTRHVTVTEIGRVYYDHCKAMLLQADAAQEAIDSRRSAPCGVVRLSCPVALLDTRISPMLAEFLDRYPQVTLHVDATDRRVDLVEEGFDLALRVRPLPLEDSDLALRRLSESEQCILASPKLLRERGRPRAPTDLSEYPSLALGVARERYVWHLQGPDGDAVRVPHQPRLVTQSMPALQAAAEAGQGVVQLPRMMVADALAEGRLLSVLGEWAPPREMLHVVFPSRRGQLPAVRTLIDFLAKGFARLDEA